MKKHRNITHLSTVLGPNTHDFSTCEKKRNVLKTHSIVRHFGHIFVISAAFALSACDNLTQRGNINPPQRRAAAANALESSASSSLSGGGVNGVAWRGNKSFTYVLSPESQCNMRPPSQNARPYEVSNGASSGNAGPFPYEVNTGIGAGRITVIGVNDAFSNNAQYGTILNNGSSLINQGQVTGRAGQTLGNLNFSSDSKMTSNIAVNPFKVWVTQEKGLYGIPMDRTSGTLDFSYQELEVRTGRPTNLITTHILHTQPIDGNEQRREYVFASNSGTSQITYIINIKDSVTGYHLKTITNQVSFGADLPNSTITSLTSYGDLLAIGFRQGNGPGARGVTALCKVRVLTNEIEEPALESLINGNSYSTHGCWLRNQVAQEQASVDNWFGSNVGWVSLLPNIGVTIMPDVPALAANQSDLESIYDSSIVGNRQTVKHVTLQSQRTEAVNMTDPEWHFKKVAGGQDRTIIALQNNGKVTAYSLDNIIATGTGHKESQLTLAEKASDMAMSPGMQLKDGTFERNGNYMVLTQAQRGTVLVLPVNYGLPEIPTQRNELFTGCAGHKIAIRPMIKSDIRQNTDYVANASEEK